jgi:hypothetical protein
MAPVTGTVCHTLAQEPTNLAVSTLATTLVVVVKRVKLLLLVTMLANLIKVITRLPLGNVLVTNVNIM